MDAFDYTDVEQAPAPRGGGLIWNILTILVLLTIGCVGLASLLIFVNPQTSLNPFPPPTEIPPFISPTATNTPLFNLPPTYTPTPTREPTSTDTPRPTWTPYLSPTLYNLPTDTPVGGVSTPQPGGWNFVLQQGTPKAISNIYHPELGCDWMGVGGQALSVKGEPVLYLFVQLGGTLEGKLFETQLQMTGTAPQYGAGGFEFKIADRLIASTQTLWIQLLDQAGLPLSDKIYFDTFADCDKNLIVIYFTQVK